MSSSSLGMIIELLVAGLLVMTIGYCIVLNSRLKNLRADEQFLKTTIAELIAATEVAERAILGLKSTTQEAEQQLGQKLRDAQFLHTELKRMTAPYQAAAAPPQIAAPRASQHQPVQHIPQPSISRSPAVTANALANFERDMMQPAQAYAHQQAAPQPVAQQAVAPTPASRDFRVFTRSAFTSRTNGG